MKIIKQNDAVFPYIAYIPDTLSQSPAMLIQLHGAGERGAGGEELDKVLTHGFPHVVSDDNLKDCILVMPQCPSNSFWVAKIESLRRFIDAMIAEYAVDTARIYLCGLSMGGYGTWYLAMAYPELFAAIAPCCGGGMAWNAGMLSMPIWAFHGLDDTLVLPSQTIEMVNALRPYHPDLHCDLYEGVGHGSWVMAFREPLLEWFLSKKKNN